MNKNRRILTKKNCRTLLNMTDAECLVVDDPKSIYVQKHHLRTIRPCHSVCFQNRIYRECFLIKEYKNLAPMDFKLFGRHVLSKSICYSALEPLPPLLLTIIDTYIADSYFFFLTCQHCRFKSKGLPASPGPITWGHPEQGRPSCLFTEMGKIIICWWF